MIVKLREQKFFLAINIVFIITIVLFSDVDVFLFLREKYHNFCFFF